MLGSPNVTRGQVPHWLLAQEHTLSPFLLIPKPAVAPWEQELVVVK